MGLNNTIPEAADFARPYRGFALYYDHLIGRRMLPLWIRNFNLLVRRYNVIFRNAADVACGTGGFAHYISSHWRVPVFGIDISPEMIFLARSKYQHQGIKFLVQDMRRLALPNPVDLITCNFDSLNYLLSVSDLYKTFRRFRENLSHTGYLVFDMISDNYFKRPQVSESYFYQSDRIISRLHVTYDVIRKLRIVTITNYRRKRENIYHSGNETHIQRAYPVSIILFCLVNSGFTIKGMLDAYTLCPAHTESTRVIFVAQTNVP